MCVKVAVGVFIGAQSSHSLGSRIKKCAYVFKKIDLIVSRAMHMYAG